MRRWLKICFCFILIMILLCVGLAVFTQSRLFKNWLRDRIITQAGNSLNGFLQIGRIEGNLITHFKISDILVTSEMDTVLFIPRLALNLSPELLLKKEIGLRLIMLDSPYFRLKQAPDSSWNVANLLVSEESQSSRVKESKTAATWHVSLKDMRLKNAHITFLPLSASPVLPQRIEKINTRALLTYNKNGLRVRLHDLRFYCHQPDFAIKKISFDLTLRKNTLLARNLILKTMGSTITGEAAFHFSSPSRYRLRLTAAPLDFSEVSAVVSRFPLIGQPNVMLNATLEHDSLTFDANFGLPSQQIHCSGTIDSIKAQPHYEIHVNLYKVLVADWLNSPGLNGLVNGELIFKGTGKNLDTANLSPSAELHDCDLLQRPVKQIVVAADYFRGNLNGAVQVMSDFGQLHLNGNMTDIRSSQRFELEGRIQDLNLMNLFPRDSLESNINFAFHASGFGFNPDTMQHTALRLNLSPSEFMGYPIDTLFSIIKIQQQDILIDTLDVESRPGQLHVSGRVNLNSGSDIRFKGKIDDLAWIKSLPGADNLKAGIGITGQVSGTLDSLRCEASYDVQDLLINTITANSMKGNLTLFYRGDSLKGQADAEIERLHISSLGLDTLKIQADMDQNFFNTVLNFSQQDSINGTVEALIVVDSVSQVMIPKIILNLKDRQLAGGSETMRVLLSKDTYVLQDIRLTSAEQFFDLSGTFSLSGAENLQLMAGNVDVAAFSNLLNSPSQLQGKLDLNIDVQGTSDSPLIDGKIDIQKGKINQYGYERLVLSFNYDQQALKYDLNLIPLVSNSLTCDGYIPLNLSLNNSDGILSRDKPCLINLKTDGLDFSVLQAISDKVRSVKGKIVCDIKLEHNIQNPRPSGYLRLINGEIKIPEYGINLKDGQIDFTVDSTRFSVQKFQARGDKGLLTATGYFDFNRHGLEGFIKTTHIDLFADNFLAVSNKNYEIVIGGAVHLSGELDSPQLDGAIRVSRSRFYLPTLIQTGPQAVEDLQPILVEVLKDTMEAHAIKLTTEKSTTDYLKNLRGKINIEIPRNTWLRSPEMNVEIAGDLNLVKQGPVFELFGSIRILRGTYNLYGKRFTIQKGTFNFEGGTEFNPDIELEAQHVFRAYDREKRTLKLEVTGKARTPTLRFTLDAMAISEGDAISYLLLGRSLEELTHGQKSELNKQVEFNAGSEASNIMVGLVAGHLSRTLGRTLNLDVIEFKGEENWQHATFIFGKYLTNDLFLSYQKEFGMRPANELKPDEITLEYEVNRRFFLQLTKGSEKNTGFDLVLKFEK